MSLTAALAEAYSNQPAGEAVYETLEFDHPAFDAPLRIVTGVPADIDLPLVFGGMPVTFTGQQISVTLPGATADGPTPLRIRVDQIGNLLVPYFRAASQSTEPITVTYRAYSTTDLTQPGDVISGLELRDADLGPVSAEATVGFREIELQAFPLATYDQQYYPALQQD